MHVCGDMHHIQAFEWGKMYMSKDVDKFLKRFDKIELADSEIDKDLLYLKNIKSIPKIKAFNCATATKENLRVHVRDS